MRHTHETSLSEPTLFAAHNCRPTAYLLIVMVAKSHISPSSPQRHTARGQECTRKCALHKCYGRGKWKPKKHTPQCSAAATLGHTSQCPHERSVGHPTSRHHSH